MTMTLCMLSPDLADRFVDVFPVLVELAELRVPLCGEGVVLARRAGLGFAPLVVDEPLAAHLAQERVEGAFLRREIGVAEALQDVGDVDLVGGNDLENQELEASFADRGEFLSQVHGLISYLVITRQQ